MKKHVRDFCKRGLIAAWGGPVIMALVWLCLKAAGVVETLTVDQVALGIISTTVMAFIAAGISIVYHIMHQLIRIATPRHNGKVERQNRINEVRFYSHLRMYSLNDGRKQLAVYQSKTNTYWKHCLGMSSPNEVVEKYLGVM